MERTSHRTTTGHRSIALLLAVLFSVLPTANAGDSALEHEQLATLARQLDLIDRLAEHAAGTAPQSRARYHFDYGRLRADLQRVRAGIQDYLVPQRAQPRDPVPLAGAYTRSSGPAGREGPAP